MVGPSECNPAAKTGHGRGRSDGGENAPKDARLLASPATRAKCPAADDCLTALALVPAHRAVTASGEGGASLMFRATGQDARQRNEWSWPSGGRGPR